MRKTAAYAMPRRSPSYNVLRGLVRQSWNKINLYNLQSLQSLPKNLADQSVFQQKWFSKRWTRAYHGHGITERQFQRSHFRAFVGENPSLHPAGVMFRGLERRLDVIVFRALFAPSIYNARQLVTHGKVRVNGKKMPFASFVVKDGDLVQVDPEAVWMLSQPDTVKLALKHLEKQQQERKKKETQPDQTLREDVSLEQDEKRVPSLEDTMESGGHIVVDADHTTVSEENHLSESMDESSAILDSNKDADVYEQPLAALKWNHEALPGRLVLYKHFSAPFMYVPDYLDVNYATCSAVFLREPRQRPDRVEIPSPWPPQVHALAHEFYARKRRR